MRIRVLIVDDHESWRRYVSETLRKVPKFQIIGEAGDGLEAVEAATRLKPDLMVLDVGLPTVNGIAAAQRILTVAPDLKILFLSEHRSPDVAQAALATGACGYVLKSNAGTDLLPALETIIQGKPFLSSSFVRDAFERTLSTAVRQETHRHEVGFSLDEGSLLDGFARFVESALKAGSAAVVVATSPHREAIHQRLHAGGLDVKLAIEEGRYLPADAVETLSTFVVDGWPEEERFWKTATTLIGQVAKACKAEHPRVAVCAECAPTLLREGYGAGALRLEQLCNELVRRHPVDIWCGYSVGATQDDDERVFQQICAEHSAVHWG